MERNNPDMIKQAIRGGGALGACATPVFGEKKLWKSLWIIPEMDFVLLCTLRF